MKRIVKLFGFLAILALAGGAGYYARGPITAALETRATEVASVAGPARASHGAAPGTGERKVLYWVDPMHPAYKSDKPGTAPDCGMDLVPVYADASPEAEDVPAGAVKISPQKLQRIGVTYGEVTRQPLSRTIRTVGRVAYDETKISRIHTKVEGWLEQVFVDYVGKLVEKNQPLATIYSPELVATQQEFLIARKARDTLGGNPVKEVSSGALSIYESAKERLRLWDVSEEQIRELEERGKPSRTLTLYAPTSGFVLTRNAFPRQRVTPDTELYAIADLSTVWVLADVYEYETPMIRLGQRATVTLAYAPGRTYAGRLTYVYPQLDSTTRTLKVRLEFPNPGFHLKPDMFASVELRIDYGMQLSVPEEALLDSGTEQIVFIAHEGGYFEPRKVQVGGKMGGQVVILSGLKAGEKIVTSGNFLIDSESRLKSALGAMVHAGGQGAEAPAGGEPKAPAAKAPAPPPKAPAPKKPAPPAEEHRH
jgi:multidrug efflux pump subunit AcrA (membrane-fusion protein)